MKRSAGVTASAVISFVGSAVSILFAALMVITLLTTMRGIPPQATGRPLSPAASFLIFAVLGLFYTGFGVWGIVSAVGLLKLRNWARICFAVFGGILCFFSLCGAFGLVMAMLFMPQTAPPPNNVQTGIITAVFAALAVIALLCAALGIWWMIYFNRSGVKVQFLGEAAAAAPRQFPLSITIIAWFLIVGSASSLVLLFLPFPTLLFGFVLRGSAAKLLFLLMAVVSLAAGIGILRKRIEAHSLAIVYIAFGLLNAVSFLVIPGSAARMQDLSQEISGGTPAPANLPQASMMFGMVFGLVMTGVMLWFLITRRRAFIRGCSESQS